MSRGRYGGAYDYGNTNSLSRFKSPSTQQNAAKSYQGMSGAGFLSTSGMDAVTATMEYGMNARRQTGAGEDDYFYEDEEPARTSSRDSRKSDSRKRPAEDDDEEDELDAFMASVEVQAKKDKQVSIKNAKEAVNVKPGTSVQPGKKVAKQELGRMDVDLEDDDQESYFKWITEQEEKRKLLGDQDEYEEELDWDAEGNPIKRKKFIDPLPPLDHSTVNYKPFEKNFYTEHDDISQLQPAQIVELRGKLGISVSGCAVPKPVTSFGHFGFDEQLMDVVRKCEYTSPTPIQAQGVPVAMSGRDIIGIAKTGSGKTAAYIWPALLHVMDQRELEDGDGPICLVCVPTRELAIQVYNEARRFGKAYNINVVCAYGGGSKWEQSKALQQGAEIVVCTPGRMIDHIKIKSTNFDRVTYLVFDEADRMFDLGFETQVRSIANHVRPDRQCLLFSATFKKRIERLARDILTDPVRVIQGQLGEANTDITQHAHIFETPEQKWQWFTDNLVRFIAVGKVLVFVSRKLDAENVAVQLRSRDFNVGLLHGDMMQHERNETINSFRHGRDMMVLVATDVAARGLDISSIHTVVNYDMARDSDTHVHRIGRTGRAGQKGDAHTLVTPKDKEYAGHLVRSLEAANQPVDEELMAIAMQAQWFAKGRYKQGKAKRLGIGGSGLGFKERKGLSAPEEFPCAPKSFNASALGVREMVTKQGQNQGAGSEESAERGGGARVSAIRTAFSSGYKSMFQAASSDTSWESHQVPITDPTPEWKKLIQQVQARQVGAQATDPFKAPPPPAPAPSSEEPAEQQQETSGTGNVSFGRRKSRWT